MTGRKLLVVFVVVAIMLGVGFALLSGIDQSGVSHGWRALGIALIGFGATATVITAVARAFHVEDEDAHRPRRFRRHARP